MTGKGPPLWELRDDRTLSWYAKLAYLMLWSRLPDCHPSLALLAEDMGVSRATAKRGVRELEDAGLLRRIARLAAEGDPDSNGYELERIRGGVTETLRSGHTEPGGGVTGTPKDSNHKTASEGPIKSAGLPAGARKRARRNRNQQDAIADVKRAIDDYYVMDCDDQQAVNFWWSYLYSAPDPVADAYAYATGVIQRSYGAPLTSLLSANSPAFCFRCEKGSKECGCAIA